MIDSAKLKEKILDLAIRGKLVPQDPNDEPASVLLEKIRAEKLQMVKEGKLKPKDIKDDSIIFVGDDNLHYEKFADGSIKCIEDEIPFEIPKSWAWCRLGVLAQYKKGPFGSSITKSMFVPESSNTIKIYEQKNAINKDANLGNYFISNEKFQELKSFEVFPNDVIVSCAGTIGETYIMPQNMRKGIINQALMKITLFDLRLLDFYLIYFDCKLKQSANEQGYGVALKNIPPFDILKQYLMPIPPLNEQSKIINVLNNYLSHLDIININKNDLLKSIDSFKSKILDMAIRGKLVPQDPNDEPADVLLERIRKEKEELIKQGKIKRDKKESIIFKGDDNSYYEAIGTEKQGLSDQINFSLPKNWSISRLESICKLCDGIKINNEKLPYLDAKTLRKIKTPELRTSGKIVLPGTKLILVDGENSGEVFIADTRGYLGSTFKILEINKNTNQDFINLVLSFYRNIFKENKTGSAVPHLNKKLFKYLLIGIPPLREQEQISMNVNNIFKTLNLILNSL